MKGFVSVLLMLVLLLIMINVIAFGIILKDGNEKLTSIGIENEKKNFERTIMENNIDRIIYFSLKREMRNEKNVSNIKKKVNNELYKYIKNDLYIMNLFFQKTESLHKSKLNEMSSVAFYEKNGIKYGEYIFTSNIFRDKILGKVISKNSECIIKIPYNYTIRILDI